ncbi:hypothetical protein [Winogradskyella sp.]|uniref:hypothetical protein n=3 Tax=Winogradskyella sp. TaxID=1883156 RepID=UPI003515B348
MKKLYLILLSSLIMFSCDNEKKEMMAEFNAITEKNDSISKVHNSFENTLEDMTATYDRLFEAYKDKNVQDSTILINFEEQAKLLERHDAIVKSHAKIIEAHKNAEPDFETLDTNALNEKIDEMKKWHEQMKNDHETLKEEHERLEKHFVVLKDRINNLEAKN